MLGRILNYGMDENCVFLSIGVQYFWLDYREVCESIDRSM